MSLDNILNLSNKSKQIHSDYQFEGSNYNNLSSDEIVRGITASISDTEQTVSFAQEYSVPLESVRSQIFGTEQIINTVRLGIEDSFLRKIFVNAYIEPELQEAHRRVWKEVCKFLNIPETEGNLTAAVILDESKKVITKDRVPDYICFDEYAFAERLMSTASRRLISEFDRLVAHSTFSYFFQIRKLLTYFLNELFYIKNSLLFDFGETYENESQQKIAVRYDTWAKMALHYTRRIAATIAAPPHKIPNSEVDKISKTQAAQFQAFFAIRLDAVDSEINDILSILKRDLTEDCEIFYKRYLSSALNLNKGIADSFNLDYNTTSFSKNFPFLNTELVLATGVLEGNFASVHADLIERYENFIVKTDTVITLVHEKRKFASYISQLAEKAVQKKKIIETITDDQYGPLFRGAIIVNQAQSKYTSGHSNLDNLDADDHPQYLLKSGGTITGDILLANNAKIDGISVSEHVHNGLDGSSKISPTSIDYDSVRKSENIENFVIKPTSITIDGFNADIIDGGIPVFDAILNIEIDTEESSLNNYEFEIIYTEIN